MNTITLQTYLHPKQDCAATQLRPLLQLCIPRDVQVSFDLGTTKIANAPVSFSFQQGISCWCGSRLRTRSQRQSGMEADTKARLHQLVQRAAQGAGQSVDDRGLAEGFCRWCTVDCSRRSAVAEEGWPLSQETSHARTEDGKPRDGVETTGRRGNNSSC